MTSCRKRWANRTFHCNSLDWFSVLALLWVGLVATFLTTSAQATNNRIEPNVHFVGRGPVLPISANQALPITTINVEEVDVDILRVNDPAVLLSEYYFNSNIDNWGLRDISRSVTSVYMDRYSIPGTEATEDSNRLTRSFTSLLRDRKSIPKTAVNEYQSSQIKLPNDLKPGWYLVILKVAGSYRPDQMEVRHVLLTDIGIQARVFKDSLTIRAASLSTGAVITSGVAKRYNKSGKLIETVKINKQGQAHFVRSRATNREVIIVESGEHSSILPLREVPLDLSEYQVGGRTSQQQNLFIYSNRDLLRPGDSLPINILLRNNQGNLLPKQPLTITLLNAQNKEVLTQQIEPADSGYYHYTIESQPFWLLGRYTLEVRADATADKPLNVFRFQLEEFTPERMDLTFKTDDKIVTAGETVSFDLTGRYLFGTPANGNTLKTEVNYSVERHFPGKFSDYVVGKPHQLEDDYHALKDTIMSEEGLARVHVPTPKAKDIFAPVKIVSHFGLLEGGGAAVQRSHASIAWRDAPIPALLPHEDTFTYQSQAAFDLAILDAKAANMVAGTLQVTVDYDQGKYYWIYEEGQGWQKREQSRWKNVVERTITLTNQSQLFEVPVNWGNYRITLKDMDTGIETEYKFYAGWYNGSKQTQAKPDHLAISLDKSHYKNGDSAEISIQVPADGELTLTVDGDFALFSETLQVKKGKQKITVPVDTLKEWQTPNLYITTTLTANVSGQPKRYFGVIPLQLDRKDRELSVDMALPNVIRPEKKLTVPVKVTGEDKNKKTWVTLSMVDKGVINLSRFKPQDPYQFFYGQQRYSADVIDLYSRLYAQRPDPFATSRFGSDSVEMLENKNNDLREIKTIALMSAPVEIKDGVANITVNIPDYNGEVQIIATVFNDNQFGTQVKDQTVAAKVVTELALPSFFVPGDKSSISIDLTNLSGSEQTLNVKLSLMNDAITFIDSNEHTVVLQDKQQKNIVMPVLVKDNYQYNYNVFNLDVSSAKSTVTDEPILIHRDWRIPIRPITPLQRKQHSMTIQPNEMIDIPDSIWEGFYPAGIRRGMANIAYSPQIDMHRQVDALFRYPYGCSEQLTSKAFPFLYDLAEVKAAKQEALAKVNKTVEQTLIDTVQNLAIRQTNRGGFSLWDDNSKESLWLTVYVTDFLMRVDKQYPSIVPKKMLEKALEQVKYYVTSPHYVRNRVTYVTEYSSTIAYAAYVTALNGQLTWGNLKSLMQGSSFDREHDRWASKLAYAQIAASYAMIGDSTQAERMLRNLNSQQRSTERYVGDYGSRLRDDALVAVLLDELLAKSLIDPTFIGLKNQLLKDTIRTSQKQKWFSTQENNAMFRAAVVGSNANNEWVHVQLDALELRESGKINHEIKAGQTLTNLGKSPLVVEFATQGYPTSAPDSLLNDSIHFTKTLYHVDGRQYQNEPLNIGDRLIVDIHLELNSGMESMDDALLVDLIPAGFNLENPDLNQGPSIESLLPMLPNKRIALSEVEYREFRQDRYIASLAVEEDKRYRFSYVIRAETFGEYAVPAMQLESMYRPSERFITKGNVATITVGNTATLAP